MSARGAAARRRVCPKPAVVLAAACSSPLAIADGPPADARDPHAYSDGRTLGATRPELADDRRFGSVLFDTFEVTGLNNDPSLPFHVEAWYGGTFERVAIHVEGSLEHGEVAGARSEILWSHALSAFWDTRLGIRYDSGPGQNPRWLAFGIAGLAPYKLEVEASGYLGEGGRMAVRLDASYELLLTQRWILEPSVGLNAYGLNPYAHASTQSALLSASAPTPIAVVKTNAGHASELLTGPSSHAPTITLDDGFLGDGLADVTVALRLRYEIRPDLAPYVGIEHTALHRQTRRLARGTGEALDDTRLVAGVRFWF